MKVSTATLIDDSFPRLLSALGRTHCPKELSERILNNQLSFVKQIFHKLSPEQVGAAKNVFLESGNYLKVVLHDATSYFVNCSKRLVQYDAEKNRVTKARVNQWHCSPAVKSRPTFTDLESRYLTLYEVKIGDDSACRHVSCTCPQYCNNGWICSHILAVMHIENMLDIRHLSALLEPIRGIMFNVY